MAEILPAPAPELRMEVATKAESEISALSRAVGCSQDGDAFIKQALDPFCDDLRDPVGMPDMEVGNSVVQHVKRTYTYTVGASPEDVHIFLDNLDTEVRLSENTSYVDGVPINGNFIADSLGATFTRRGGVRIRKGPVGSVLNQDNDFDHGNSIALPGAFLANGSTRVCAKAMEVHNVSNKLIMGGAVTVYRATGDIPYNKDGVGVVRNSVTPTTISNSFEFKACTAVPATEAEATVYPGSQTWEAADGCYIVAMPGAQTNEVSDATRDDATLVASGSSVANPTKSWINVVAANTVPRVIVGEPKIFSPFFVSGAFFTGLPAGSQLKINVIYYLERFISANSASLDLVTMGKPSPYYDPAAMELYSKTAQHAPVGTKVKNNADGDWIKNIADLLSTFGVPGMPFVKGAVDLWNGLPSGDTGSLSKSSIEAGNSKAIRQVQKKMNNNQKNLRSQEKQIENAVSNALSRFSVGQLPPPMNSNLPPPPKGKNAKKNAKKRAKKNGKK